MAQSPPGQYTKWGEVSTADATTFIHTNTPAVMIVMEDGEKMVYLADQGRKLPNAQFEGRMDTIHAYDDWHPWVSCTENHNFEEILLGPGDVLYTASQLSFSKSLIMCRFVMPNTRKYELTVKNALARVWNFQATRTTLAGMWAYIHAQMLELSSHIQYDQENAFVVFIQIFAYWFTNLKLIYEGLHISPHIIGLMIGYREAPWGIYPSAYPRCGRMAWTAANGNIRKLDFFPRSFALWKLCQSYQRKQHSSWGTKGEISVPTILCTEECPRVSRLVHQTPPCL
jgi:hypothetical protein